MQEIEMEDYENDDRGQGNKLNTNRAERRTWQFLLLSFGVLCILQAILNLSLRLAFHSKQILFDTSFNNDQGAEANMKCEQEISVCYKELQERFKALIHDKTMLENRNNELINKMKTMEEEYARLIMKLKDLNGCVTSQRCPPGWREINSRCYFLSTETKTWDDSRKDCQSNGADLVIINNEQEQRDIYRLNGDQYLLFWIGLRGKDGNFKWVDGSEPTNLFWQTGQPDHGGPNNVEDCVEMYHKTPVINNWNDATCGQKKNWLCEKELCISP